jgi:hypothetical protein
LGDSIATVLNIQKYYLSNVYKRELIEKAEKESDFEIPKAKSTKSTAEKPRAKAKKARTKDEDAKGEAKKESKDQKATVKVLLKQKVKEAQIAGVLDATDSDDD